MMRPALALCMLIDDDEEEGAQSSIQSLLGLIDYWIVCDVGTNNRASVVTELLDGVPGELHRRDWLDFGHNRNELLDLAHGKAEYLLLVDPGTIISLRGKMPELVEDVYVLSEVDDSYRSFGTPRMVREARGWWYTGSTHEVLTTNGRFHEIPLENLVVQRRSAASHRRRSLRNKVILEREVANGQDLTRNTLLLAETLKELGNAEEAVCWYRERATLGASDQDTFYAKLQEGMLRARDNFPSAVPVLLDAWRLRPTRAEPFYELARGYRERGDAGLSYTFANLGLGIPESTDTLFVQGWIYDWGLSFERGWASGLLGRVDEAVADLQVVLTADGVPSEVLAMTRDRILDLTDTADLHDDRGSRAPSSPAPALASLAEGVHMGRLHLKVDPGWTIFNPTIASDGGGFLMIVRSANYWPSPTGERPVIERRLNVNYLVELDAGLDVLKAELIDEEVKGTPKYPADKAGFMDYRLVNVGGRWYASATSREMGPTESWQMVLLELMDAKVVALRHLAAPHPGSDEKNWMPFVHDDALHFVYSCDPLVVFRCDIESGQLTTAVRSEPRMHIPFHGGSQGVPLNDGGYLFVVHELYFARGRRNYLHRLIRMGSNLQMNAFSPGFTFTDDTREFCAGAAIRGDELVLSFGQKNTAAYIAVLPLASALELLEPIGESS